MRNFSVHKTNASFCFIKGRSNAEFSKMNEEKLRMLKDDRFGRRSRKQFHEMIDILIEFSNEPNIGELKSLKSLK